MKRKWAYLGAALPLSTAVSTWVTADGAQDDAGKMLRSKNGLWLDEDGEKSDGTKDHPPGKESPGIKAPPRDAYGDEGSRAQFGSDLDSTSGVGGHGVQVSVPDTDSSMYAPAQGDHHHASFGGAAGSASTVVRVIQENEIDETPVDDGSTDGNTPTPADNDPGDTGYVEPDPADADAMLVLLGGAATGTGEGAASSGEVDLEIVDYGPITIALGYAKYFAAGGDGATADTFATVEGADLVYTFGDDYDQPGYGSPQAAYSVTYVVAIDFEDDDAEQQVDWREFLGDGPFAMWTSGEEEDVSVSGNHSQVALKAHIENGSAPSSNVVTQATDNTGSIAAGSLQTENTSLSLASDAFGPDTLTFADGSLLEIEDQFSSVGGVVTGVG